MRIFLIPFFAVATFGAESTISSVQLQADLRAAAEARAQLADEDQRWQEELQRLQIVTETQRRAIIALDAESQDLITARRPLEQEVAAEPDQTTVESLVTAGAQKLASRMQEAGESMLPGVLTVPAAQVGDEVLMALATAIQAAEHANDRYAVVTLEGELDGQPRVVRALRAGGACAWWVGLDGKQAGIVRREGKHLRFESDPDPVTRVAIVGAMERIEGRGAPGLVLLPLPPVTQP